VRTSQFQVGTLLAFLLLLCLGAGCAPPNDQGNVSGPPSLSPDTIDQILLNAHSPAGKLGATLTQLSQQYHIDNAFALAFFHHESSYGVAGIATVTHSLGNIRCSAGYACLDGYRAYPTWADGARDWYQLISTVYLPNGLNTVSKIIPVYAPAADNNNEAVYIQSVLSDVARYRAQERQI
jgi:hypothetical protein